MTSDFAQGFCCGAVNGGVKLCTSGIDTCTVKIHKTKKVDVTIGSLYIAAGRNAAYAQHHADTSTLTSTQLTNVLNECRSKDEWVRLLYGLKLSQEALSIPASLDTLSAITPAKKHKAVIDNDVFTYGRGSPPPGLAESFSDESDALVIISSASSEEMYPEEKIGNRSQQWDDVVNSLNRLTAAFKRLKSTVGSELEMTDDRITGVDARFGNPVKGSVFEECITSWDGILSTRGEVEDLRKEFDDSKQGLSEMSASNIQAVTEVKRVKRGTSVALAKVNGHIEELATVVKALSDEQAVVTAQVQLNASPVSVAAFHDLESQVRRLHSERDFARRDIAAEDPTRSTKAEAEIAALKIQMNILSSRIPVDATMLLGGHIFKSKGDVQLFVEKKMSTNLFHLCHDPITLLESLTGLHVEKKDVLNEMYQADRVGMNDAEARHCASFRLILPTVFGYVKEGASTRHNMLDLFVGIDSSLSCS